MKFLKKLRENLLINNIKNNQNEYNRKSIQRNTLSKRYKVNRMQYVSITTNTRITATVC